MGRVFGRVYCFCLMATVLLVQALVALPASASEAQNLDNANVVGAGTGTCASM